MKFANNEIAIILAMLIHKYDMTLDKSPEQIWIGGMMRPDVKIHYHERVPQPDV